MKRQYIKPSLRVKEMNTTNMLLSTSGDTSTLNTGDTIDSAEGALGRENNRRPSIWDQGW